VTNRLPATPAGARSKACDELTRALGRLTSLQEGDLGVLDVVACGTRAVPKLRALLFRREVSGLYQPRCRAVEALAALDAHDVLIEFLNTDRDIADPVERAGEDAVINAVARAVCDVRDEAVFRRLLSIAETRWLAGAIDALGSFRRPEALACLTAALGDDLARPAAEDALRQFGRDAMTALVAGATDRTVQACAETESSRRRRRAALALMLEAGGPAAMPSQRRAQWMHDDDPEIAVLGCGVALRYGDAAEKQTAVRRLVDMLGSVHWRVRHDIEDCLVAHGEDARLVVQGILPTMAPSEGDRSPAADAQRSLNRVARRLRR
jgi:hypothetical protein